MTKAHDPSPSLDALVGSFRRFGPTGPVYQIVAAGEASRASTPAMSIRLVESGEELDYRVDRILEDPEA